MTDNLLSKIKSPADLKKLDIKQLKSLPKEIRELIVKSVSEHGGHLASNLGVVELTMALNYVFDFSKDKIVWDVGHQCYVHKILTGRADKFSQLRKAGGISGFPAPSESEYDQFAVGHAGTSVASALGLALGCQIIESDDCVVAVVGDASIVNGLSFEGLNNTHLCNRQLLIILNDNFMAIDKTEGAFAQYLTKLRVSRTFEDMQRRTAMLVRRLPLLGKGLQERLDRIRDGLHTTFFGKQKFDQLGIPFFGPIDGHDLPSLIKILSAVKEIDHPVILHVLTNKGHGSKFAVEDPTTFHSPKPFKVETEGRASFEKSSDISFTKAFSNSLDRLMEKDEKVIALTAAMPDGTGLVSLRDKYPDRVIDVGIAESSAIDIAAGMAKVGLKPVVAIYSTFMQRAFDQIFQEVSLQDLPVTLCMDRAGLVGEDGAVHHGFCDISLFRTLPNLVLMAPIDEIEMDQALEYASKSKHASVIRYPRDIVHRCGIIPECETEYETGKAVWLRPGADVVVVAYGGIVSEVMFAADHLAKQGIEVGVVNARFAKPLDEKLFSELLADDKDMPVFTIEDHGLIGGFGAAVVEMAQLNNLDARKITRLGLPDEYIGQDTRHGQLVTVGIDSESIAKRIKEKLGR
ncbi:MAG: 1-deoxy-D-xylulose-5-phosphate synthase [Phycisphaerae bacterium]|nr:1-deoxy-D-xylulose-5-phosphate synthase [Phycisphaerae bacterium]